MKDFLPTYLVEKIDPLNEVSQSYYPLPFTAKKDSFVRQLMNERKFTMELDQVKSALSQ